MKIKLKKELNFIAQPGLIEFSLEKINGIHVIKEGSFKQNIKASEYAQIIDNQVSMVEKVNTEVKKTDSQLKAEKKAERAKKAAEKKAEAPKPEKPKDPMEDDF